MKTLSGQGNNVTYAYNGLGDRLRETVNSNPTTFTMDLNAGLTQALSDGTSTYIYGLDRIAQVTGTSTEYFLSDALGSVRQLTNASGAITYATAYDPYGEVTTANGSSSTAYGYTGEFTSNNLVYLRARQYAPGMGRFLTQDTWGGDENAPMSYNRWNYGYGNPVNYIDPSGHFPQECNAFGWCKESYVDGFVIYLTRYPERISANVYKNGERERSQFFTNDPKKNGLCGAVTFAAMLRTQNPSLTGNQIIDELDNSKIGTNWTGQENIEDMAAHFGWDAIRTTPKGTALTLSGSSDARRKKLLSLMTTGWIPVIGLKTDQGFVERNGTTTHWISAVGIGVKSGNWFLYIYNPVNDRVTEYSWPIFYGYLSREWTSPTDKTKTKYYHNMLVEIRPPAMTHKWPMFD